MDELMQKKMNNGREYRRMELVESRAVEDEYIVEGYATKFNQPYTLYSLGDYEVNEQIAPGAFDSCDMSDTILQYDHEGRVFARVSNQTLKLSVDSVGLKVSANLGGTEGGRQLYDEIKGGYITKMSFGFVVSKDERKAEVDNERNKEVVLRTITAIKKLYDVSAVSIPANDATEITARAYGEGVIAEAEEEFRKAQEIEKKKNRLKLLLEL